MKSNTMLKAYAMKGYTKKAEDLAIKMKIDGIRINSWFLFNFEITFFYLLSPFQWNVFAKKMDFFKSGFVLSKLEASSFPDKCHEKYGVKIWSKKIFDLSTFVHFPPKLPVLQQRGNLLYLLTNL